MRESRIAAQSPNPLIPFMNSTQKSGPGKQRILVGRARHQASALSRSLRSLGADVIEIPFIEIRAPRSYRPLDSSLKQINKYDWLILTSVNGVDAMQGRMQILGIKPAALGALNIAAIGPATRERIESLGLKVDVVPKRYVAESVVESLRAKVKGKRVLLARAKVARDVIPRELKKLGAKVDEGGISGRAGSQRERGETLVATHSTTQRSRAHSRRA